MTNPPDLTARVDALIYHMSECHTLDNHDQQTVIDMRDTIRALSAERDDQKKARLEAVRSWVSAEARAEAAEAERDALKVDLADAVGVLEESLEAMHEAHSECRDYADTHPFIEQLDSARERARALLARHQKETGV